MTRYAVLWALLFVACDKPTTQASAPVAKPEPTAEKPRSVAPRRSEEPEPAILDDDARAALADKACPRVVAPYYYRIEKAGKISYVLGTRHLGVSLDKMPGGVKDQLAKAKLVVFETPPGDNADADETEHGSLADALGPQLWAKYKHLAGPDVAAALENATPSAAMLTMMMMYENQRAALDSEIEVFVADKEIATAGLESSAFQDQLLNELIDVRMLKAAITGTPSRATLKREAVDDLAEYCTGTDEDPGMDARTRELLKKGGYTDADIAKLDDRLLHQRNNAWMPKLEDMFGKGDVFVVVGADHLIGPRGVVAMLGQRGFKTSRIR